MTDTVASVTRAAVALVGATVIAGVLLALGGHDPIQTFAALADGAFGSTTRFVSFTLVRSTPLLLTGLAVALAFRAGVWNIGAEGQLYAGALAGVAAAMAIPEAPSIVLIPVTLLAGVVAGTAWAAIPAVMKMKLGVGEVITTILMNFVALNLARFLVQGPLQESRGVFPQTNAIPEAAVLPPLIPGTRLHFGFFLAIILALGLWIILTHTVFGFRIRAVGAAEGAARASGRINTQAILWGTFLGSGALAGLAGWIEVAGVTRRMYEGLSPGWGYTAIAVALLARLNPLGVIATAVIFGALAAGSGAMQRDAGVPDVWARGIEALVILTVLILDRNARRSGVDDGPAHPPMGDEANSGAMGGTAGSHE